MINNTPRFMNPKQAAEMLGIHPMTLKAKARSGEIPAGKSGRKWVFLDVDLIEYIRAQYKSNETTDDFTSCHSTKGKIRNSGGSRSTTTEEQYTKALGLTTNSKLKNTTTN